MQWKRTLEQSQHVPHVYSNDHEKACFLKRTVESFTKYLGNIWWNLAQHIYVLPTENGDVHKVVPQEIVS
jgi:hypothetical protein